MHDSDLWRLDATAQAALVRAREVSPLELVEAAIARVEALNPRVNAVITPLYDRAIAQGRAYTAYDAPFAGVPMLVKDACLEIEGTPYALGTSVLRDIGYTSKTTTELAHRFERAGFIVIGKTNLPELSSGINASTRAFGATRNPWHLDMSAGGSSGGSAAAVACGMTSIAHGGDATGSLRYPAACCGLVTLKPTRGRLPSAAPAGQPDPFKVWVDFVLTRTVRDLAATLDAVHGAGAGDPFDVPAPPYPFAACIEQPPRGLRIGLLHSDVMARMPVDPACAAAVDEIGALLATLGHHVEEAHPPALDGIFLRTFAAMPLIGTVFRYTQHRWLAQVAGRELTQDDLDNPLVTAAQAEAISAVAFNDALALMESEFGRLHEWWDEGWDVLITPLLKQPSWPLDSKDDYAAGVFPPPFSFSGQPAMSVPADWTDDGIPLAVQLAGARGRDDVLLALAAQIEAARPWAHRWPTISETAV